MLSYLADWLDSTGVTGYIAGDAFYALNKAHPEYEYAALVRTQEKADTVKKAYPSVRIVLGGLDDSDILKEEAAKADVVLRASFPWPINEISADSQQMLLMLRTTRVPPRLSQRAFCQATARRSPAIGCTLAEPAS